MEAEPWKGPCPACHLRWDCQRVGAESAAESTLAALADQETRFIPTGVRGFDKVLGGGLAPGSTVLFGGRRGAGKSSLLVAVADGVATEHRKVLFASGEERAEDVGRIAKRLGATNPNIIVMGNATDADEVLERAEELGAALVVCDSLQVMTCSDVDAGEGSTAQGIAVANLVTGFCKRTSTSAIIVNHVTKTGEFSGSETVAHLVDTILQLEVVFDEDGRETKGRVLVSSKNRNGPSPEEASFMMTERGLVSSSRLSLVQS